MKRTQVYLTRSQKVVLEREARRKGTTVSALIRKFISQNFASGKKEAWRKKEPTMFDVLEDIKKLGVAGPPDLAENMDEYLYGGKE